MRFWNSEIRNQLFANAYWGILILVGLLLFPKGLDVFLQSLNLSPDYWLHPVLAFVGNYWLHFTLLISILANAFFALGKIRESAQTKPLRWLRARLGGEEETQILTILAWFVFQRRPSVPIGWEHTDFFNLEIFRRLLKHGVIFRHPSGTDQETIEVDEECYYEIKQRIIAMDTAKRTKMKEEYGRKPIDQVVRELNY